jgi:hypothetical protein
MLRELQELHQLLYLQQPAVQMVLMALMEKTVKVGPKALMELPD